jgi:hypothetical protein
MLCLTLQVLLNQKRLHCRLILPYEAALLLYIVTDLLKEFLSNGTVNTEITQQKGKRYLRAVPSRIVATQR